MLRIVYISTARTQPTAEDLEAILARSRRNNTSVGVTGLLVSGGRRFLQALEGPEEAVVRTFDRIRADPRHFAVVELARTPIEQRAFGQWAMAHEEGAQVGEDGNLAAIVASLVAPLADRSLKAQFAGFAELHAKAA